MVARVRRFPGLRDAVNGRRGVIGTYDDAVTTGLDVLALLLAASASGLAVLGEWRWAAAVVVPGLVLFGGARLAEWLRRSP